MEPMSSILRNQPSRRRRVRVDSFLQLSLTAERRFQPREYPLLPAVDVRLAGEQAAAAREHRFWALGSAVSSPSISAAALSIICRALSRNQYGNGSSSNRLSSSNLSRAMSRAQRAASVFAAKFGQGKPGMARMLTPARGPRCGDFPYARILNVYGDQPDRADGTRRRGQVVRARDFHEFRADVVAVSH